MAPEYLGLFSMYRRLIDNQYLLLYNLPINHTHSPNHKKLHTTVFIFCRIYNYLDKIYILLGCL